MDERLVSSVRLAMLRGERYRVDRRQSVDDDQSRGRGSQYYRPGTDRAVQKVISPVFGLAVPVA